MQTTFPLVKPNVGRSVDLAAKELDCSRGYIYKVLKEQGTTPRDVIEAKAR